MRWHLTRPSGFQEWRCTRDHCPQFVLTHGPIPGEQPPLYPMSQPIIYAPVGMPHELEDRARNWLFEQGYPGPVLVDTLTVPTEDNPFQLKKLVPLIIKGRLKLAVPLFRYTTPPESFPESTSVMLLIQGKGTVQVSVLMSALELA